MAKNVMVRRIKGSREVYSRRFLLEELPRTSDRLYNDAFARYQCERVGDLNPSFKASVLSVSQVHCERDGEFVDANLFGGCNVPKDAIKLYRRVHHLDVMAETTWQSTGSAIFNTDFQSVDDWLADEFYTEFKAPLGLHHTVILNLHSPFNQRARIRFSYQTEFPKTFGDDLTKDEVEFYTLPFYIVWLCRIGQIDRDTMLVWLGTLEGMTPLRLVLLRELTSFRQYRNAATAAKLGISPRVVNNQFHEIYNAVSSVLPPSGVDDGYQSKLVDLANTFSFLRFAGEFQTADAVADRINAKIRLNKEVVSA